MIEEEQMANLRAQTKDLYYNTPSLYFMEIENAFDLAQASPARETTALSGGRGVELNAATAISTTLSIVAEGEHSLALRASLPLSSAPLTVTLGTEKIHLQPQFNREELAWLIAEPVHLSAGDLPLRIETTGSAVLDAMVIAYAVPLKESDFFFQDRPTPAVLTYEQIDATRYQIYVQARQPFTLALAETYDPLWIASGPDFRVSSIPLYGAINGFEIPRAGAYQILVDYQAQQGARLGALLSAIVFLSLGPSIWLLQRRRLGIRLLDEERDKNK